MTAGDLCATSDVEAELQMTLSTLTTPTLAQVQTWITEVTDKISEETGKKYASTTATSEKHDGDGTPFVLLDHYPVLTITSLVVDGITLTASTDYWIYDYGAGQLELKTPAIPRAEESTSGHENIVVTYTYGFSAVPSAVKELCVVLVALKALSAAALKKTDLGALKSYSDGDVTLNYADTDKAAESLWRRYQELRKVVPLLTTAKIGGFHK